MKQLSLSVKTRTTVGKKTKQLRKEGFIPLVLYGQKRKTENLEVEKNKFEKIYGETGVNNLFDLKIGKKRAVKVLIHDIQTHPVTDEILHADIYAVRSDQKLKTEIPLHFRGKSEAVEEDEGNLITHKDRLEVEVLPQDLVEEIKVDISPLKTFDDVIKVKNLDIPRGIEVLEEKDDIVVNVTPPRSEEELEALDEEVEEDVEGVEVEKEKKEEEEGEEAEAAPEGEKAPEEQKPVEEAPAGEKPSKEQKEEDQPTAGGPKAQKKEEKRE